MQKLKPPFRGVGGSKLLRILPSSEVRVVINSNSSYFYFLNYFCDE
jgi:hypothetical protein